MSKNEQLLQQNNCAVLSGTGFFAPEQVIDNDELVSCFNQYVSNYNQRYHTAIEKGDCAALQPSSADFIEKASGILRRHVVSREGILDPEVMALRLAPRTNEAMSLQCEMSVIAAKQALAAAKRHASEIDCVIVACTATERSFPAMAIEIQQALGCAGFAFDLNVACSSATFGASTAASFVESGRAKAVLVVNPEICSAQLNFADRESHFIFGDACTAMVIEERHGCEAPECFDIIHCVAETAYSNNIRSNNGFLNRTHPETALDSDKLFVQQGRKVFKEVVPMVVNLISKQLDRLGLSSAELSRLWLHQANINMNRLIAEKILGKNFKPEQAPVILDEYANTSSAGSVIALHLHQSDLQSGDYGVLCSFGAGYSMGSIVLRKQ